MSFYKFYHGCYFWILIIVWEISNMAAYEDWIPLDNDIFNRLDNCDPSFCWELMKNDVIKVRFKYFDFLLRTWTENKLVDLELIGWGADSCPIFRRSLQLGTVFSCIKTSRRHEIGWDISRLFRNGFILMDHPLIETILFYGLNNLCRA